VTDISEPLAELLERLDNLLTRSFLGLTQQEADLVGDANALLDRLRGLDAESPLQWRDDLAAGAPLTRV